MPGSTKLGARSSPRGSAGNRPQRVADLDMGTLPRSLGYHLRLVQLAYKKHFLRVAGGAGLQPQHVGAMFIVGLNPGVTPSLLGSALGMDVAQVALLLNALELRGLLTRRTSQLDGRSRIVELTDAGRIAFGKLQTSAAKVETSFAAGALSPPEMETLISLLARLLAGTRE